MLTFNADCAFMLFYCEFHHNFSVNSACNQIPLISFENLRTFIETSKENFYVGIL